MKLTDLDFEYPEHLIATKPQRPSRVMLVESSAEPQEFSLAQSLKLFKSGDVLVINNTKVLKRRLFVDDLEILFLKALPGRQWEVLFPSRKFAIGHQFQLPQNVSMHLVQKGRPQIVELDQEVSESYFQTHAELALPPYIQKARGDRRPQGEDSQWYQTAWSKNPGSFAAPTASLHFTGEHLNQLRQQGVQVCEITLHVGLGTFLPVQAQDLDQHQMHFEEVEVPQSTWQVVQAGLDQGKRIWAMGTTVTRALESVAIGKLSSKEGHFAGATDLLIQPGHEWRVVGGLLTNFHQPQSTLLALVSAFTSLQKVKASYQWAIARQFKLFSYGDLSIWTR